MDSVSENTRNALFNDAMWVVSQTLNQAISTRMALFSATDEECERLRQIRDEVGKLRDASSKKLLDGLDNLPV